MRKDVTVKISYFAVLLLMIFIGAIGTFFYTTTGFLQASHIDDRDSIWERDTQGNMKGTEPFFINGTRTCWLFIHGYGSSPAEFSYLAPAIHNQTGATISVPLLKGHGTKASELQQTMWKDWYDDTRKSYEEIEPSCETINAIGSSLGATFLVQLSQEKKIETLVLLAPYVRAKRGLDDWLVNNMAYILHYVKKKRIGSINDPEGQQAHKTYWNFPIEPIQTSKKEIHNAETLTPKATTLLVIITKSDTVIDNTPAKNYYERFTGEKTILELNTSDHVMSLDYEKEKVAKEITK